MMTTTLPEPPPVHPKRPVLTPARKAGHVATANICGLLGLPLLAYLIFALRAEPFDGAIFAVSTVLAVVAYAAGVVVLRAQWERLIQAENEGHSLRLACERIQGFCARRYERTTAWCQRRPVAALWLSALCGVLLSSYPVVFLGKSFVGPAITGTLLYDRLPTLPGSTETHLEWRNGSDVGAGMLASLPYTAVERRSLFRDGEFPLWNRYNSGGVPLLGQGQSMIGDPLNLLVILAGANGWAWDLKYLLAKLLFAAGIGLTVRQSNGGRLFAAISLAFSACFLGFFIYRFNHPTYFGVCYSPWILYAWLRLAKSEVGSQKTIFRAVFRCRVGRRFPVPCPPFRLPTSDFALLLLANWMVFCSGTAKEACFLMIVLDAAGALALVLSDSLPWRQRGVRLALAAWTLGCFVLLAAPMWLTFLDALRTAWTAYGKPDALQIQPGLVAGLFDDIFYRQYNHTAMVYSPATSFLVLLGCALAAVGWKSLVRQPAFLALAVCMVGTAALVFGVVPSAFITAVPFLGNVIHVGTTFSCPLIVLLVVLSGFGLQRAHGRFEARDWTLEVWGAVGVLGLVVALFLGLTQAAQDTDFAPMCLDQVVHRKPFFWGYLATLIAAFTALPLLWRRFCLDRGGSAPGILPWSMLCLTALLWRQGLHSHALIAYSNIYALCPPARADFRQPSPTVEHILALRNERPGRTAGFNGNLTPGFGAALGLEMTSGPDALQNRYVHQLLIDSQVPTLYGWSMCVTRQDVASTPRRFYDLMNVRYYLGTPSAPGQSAEPVPPDMRLLGHDDLDLYESDTVWPRAFFTDALAQCENGQGLMHLLNSSDGRPFAAVTATDLTAQPGLRALAGRGAGGRAVVPATDYRLTNNTTTFQVHAPGPGLVAVIEGFQPEDMRVSVNGRPAPCFRVNAAFSGVYLDRAGDYTVRFRYWPRLLTPALWLAALGAGLFGLIVWWLGKQVGGRSGQAA